VRQGKRDGNNHARQSIQGNVLAEPCVAREAGLEGDDEPFITEKRGADEGEDADVGADVVDRIAAPRLLLQPGNVHDFRRLSGAPTSLVLQSARIHRLWVS
jgi:hypothetical protein